MDSFYGQLDLTRLGDIVRKHPEAVREVTFKDGTTRKFININIDARQQPSNNGHTHYVRAGIKKAEQKEGVNYFIGDLKPSLQQQQSAPTQQTAPAQSQEEENILPF